MVEDRDMSDVVSVLATKVMGWTFWRTWTDGRDVWKTGNEGNPSFTGFNPLDSWLHAGMLLDALKQHPEVTNVSLHGANGWGLSIGRIIATEPYTESWTSPNNQETGPRAISMAAYEWARRGD